MIRDRKTPLTDAMLNTHSYASIPPIEERYRAMCDHARRLEQERDAAVEALKQIAEWHMHSGVARYEVCEDYGDKYYLIESEVGKAREAARAVLAEIGEKG